MTTRPRFGLGGGAEGDVYWLSCGVAEHERRNLSGLGQIIRYRGLIVMRSVYAKAWLHDHHLLQHHQTMELEQVVVGQRSVNQLCDFEG